MIWLYIIIIHIHHSFQCQLWERVFPTSDASLPLPEPGWVFVCLWPWVCLYRSTGWSKTVLFKSWLRLNKYKSNFSSSNAFWNHGIMFSLRGRIPLGLKSLGLRLIARFKVQRCPASCLGETRKEESWTVENTLSVGKIKILKMTLRFPHREGLHLEVPAPEWVKCYLFLFYIFQFEFVPFNLFEDFFKKIFLTRVVEGRQHKMEVWQSREQEREAKEREERFRRFLLHIRLRGNLFWLNLFH